MRPSGEVTRVLCVQDERAATAVSVARRRCSFFFMPGWLEVRRFLGCSEGRILHHRDCPSERFRKVSKKGGSGKMDPGVEAGFIS